MNLLILLFLLLLIGSVITDISTSIASATIIIGIPASLGLN